MAETVYPIALTPFQADCINWWTTTPNIPEHLVTESVTRVLNF